MKELIRHISGVVMKAVKDFCAIAVPALLLFFSGCSIGSGRVRSTGYPFDFRLNCMFDKRHVIIFLIDGARADRFYEMAESGELPSIKRYFVDRGVSADCAVTSIPSITNAAIAALTCGKYPGHLGVVGNHWFDRNNLKRINLVSLKNYYVANESLNGMTIYETLSDEPTVTVSVPCMRGAKYNIHLHYNLVGLSNYLLGRWKKVDQVFLREFQDVAVYANREGIFPRVVFFHLPGMDYTSHRHGPFSSEAEGVLKNIDSVLEKLMRGLERNGVMEKVCIMLIADHGQMSCRRENYFLWESFFKEEMALPVLSRYGEKDEYFTRALGMPPLSRYDDIDEEERDERAEYYEEFSVIEANNGRNAFLYFRHNPAGKWLNPEEMAPWEKRPAWEELRHYPTRRGFVDLIERMRGEEAVDIVAGKTGEEGEIAIFSRAGEGRIQTKRMNDTPFFAYKVIGGKDPLGYLDHGSTAALMDGSFHPKEKWGEASAELYHTDVIAQLPSLFQSPLCGDLFVTAAEGWDFEKANVGGHGGLLRGEMRIPLIIAGPGIRRGRLRKMVRTVDIVPTILDYLGHGMPEGRGKLDGESFWEDIRESAEAGTGGQE